MEFNVIIMQKQVKFVIKQMSFKRPLKYLKQHNNVDRNEKIDLKSQKWFYSASQQFDLKAVLKKTVVDFVFGD